MISLPFTHTLRSRTASQLKELKHSRACVNDSMGKKNTVELETQCFGHQVAARFNEEESVSRFNLVLKQF
jgi:hypothetical protein